MTDSSGKSAALGAVVAVLLYALLVDAAIETLLGGSPVRWWTAGIVFPYLAATLLLRLRAPQSWERIGWWRRAAASVAVLLALVAFTAWLPEGHGAGVRLAGQATSTVFAGLNAVAVALSLFVLIRVLRARPLWLRALVGAVGVYGLWAIAGGLVQQTPYSQLLHGSSAWQRLPFFLQGAFLGVFVVVPLAMLAELVAAAGRLRAGRTWARDAAIVVSLGAAVMMAIPALVRPAFAPGVALAGSSARFTFADERQLEMAAVERLVDEPPPASPEVEDAVLLETAGTIVRGFRPEEWDLDALAASLGKDPAAAFAFVRDAIGFDPYPGVLRGAEGTLAARAGNAWDRALLLRTLLARSGLATRLAFATLDSATVSRVVQRAHVRPVHRLSANTPTGVVARILPAVASRARRDDAVLRLALGSRIDELGTDDSEEVRRDTARHAWVQLQQGGAWIDLDPTLPDARVGKSLTAASGTADEVPPDQQQTVVVKVVAESLSDGRLTRSVALRREMPAAVAAREHLLLAFTPKDEPGGGMLRARTKPRSYVPILWAGREQQTGQAIATSTDGGGGAGFDSLFGGGEGSARELTGLFLEFETRVPGAAPIVATHVVLDRVPPDARSSKRIEPRHIRRSGAGNDPAYALGGFHHVMISTGGASALDLARRRLRATQASVGSDGTAPDENAGGWPSSPLWAADLALVEGSERLGVQSLDSSERGRVFVHRPRVFLGSWLPEPAGPGTVARETDLVVDSVRVLPMDGTSLRQRAERQMQYGSLQSGIETETTLQIAAAWDPDSRAIVSTSLSTRGRLTVLAPADLPRLPAGSAGALGKALREGELALVPGDVATAKAWWTVARSGFVRAIVEPGGGMSGTVGKVGFKAARHVVTAAGAAAKAGSNAGGGGGGGMGERQAVEKVATDTAKEAGQVAADRAKDAFEGVAKRLAKPLIPGMF